jgi:atrophin-1 interacting protein 1/endothelial cell adhesion protein
MVVLKKVQLIIIFNKQYVIIFICEQFLVNNFVYKLFKKKNNNDIFLSPAGTTRPPRQGEINGQDYTFLSVKDFRTLDKSGSLLESGVYKGMY